MSDGTIGINVTVADRSYRIIVEKHEEEMVRKAAKIIKETLRQLQVKYNGTDKQDQLAMAMIRLCVEALTNEQQVFQSHTGIGDELDELNNLLEQCLE